MAKYRFKTKEEFIACGDWYHGDNMPDGWNRHMAYHVGQDVPDEFNKKCDENSSFYMKEPDGGNWIYSRDNYVLKESTEVKGFELHEVNEINI